MSEPRERDSARLQRSLVAYICYCGGHGATFDRSVLALYLLGCGLDEVQLGSVLSVLFLAQTLTEVPAGYFGDRVGRKLSVTTGLAVKVGWCLGMLVASRYWHFLVLFALAGLSRSLISGSDHSLVYDLMKQHGRERTFVATEVKARALAGLALSVAMGVAGYLLALSPALLYGCYALTSGLALLAWSLIADPGQQAEAKPVAPAPAPTLIDPRGRRRLFAVTVFGFAALSAVIAPFYFFAQTKLVTRGLSAGQVGLVYGGAELLAALTVLLAKRVEARLTFLEIFVGFSLLSAAALWLVSNPGLTPMIVGFGCLVLFTPIFDVVIIHALHRRLDSRRRASWMSVASVVVTLAAAAGYAGWGAIDQWLGEADALRLLAGVPLLALAVVLVSTRWGQSFDPTRAVTRR